MGRSNGGSPHSSLTSDTTFNLFDPAMVPHYFLSCTAPTDPTCYGRIHAEIDHDWKAAGYCGTGTACDNTTLASQTVTATTKIDIQGFVYWDNGNLNSSWHQYNGWEIHPVTGWRISNPNPPDYTLTTSPSNVKLNAGITGNSILTVNSTNGFTGTVDLTAAANSTSLTCTLASTSINNGSGTSAISCNSSVAGNYLATVTGTSGTLTHTAIVVFQVQDFKINANPSSLTISSVSGTPARRR